MYLGRRIRELTSVVQKRFKFPENGVELYAEKVNNRGLCAILLRPSLFGTSFWEALQLGELAMVSCALSWRVVQKVAR